MDEPIVTFGVLMGMEIGNGQDNYTENGGKEVLLLFCPTTESEQGNIDITPRIKDFALMGFLPVAITRCNPEDTSYYAVFAREGLSDLMKNAVLTKTGTLVLKAFEGFEFLN